MRPAEVVTGVSARAYTIPTDAPEGDGTMTWIRRRLWWRKSRAGEAWVSAILMAMCRLPP